MLSNDLIEQIHELSLPKHFCLALSGGLDSIVLLHLFVSLTNLDPSIHVRAIHVNHGLSPNANDWTTFCQNKCTQYQINFESQTLSFQRAAGESLEAVARTHRYKVFESQLKPGEVLVTAHHQQDQAETLLLQLFRGAGPKGLSAMPVLATFSAGHLFRPLLNVTQESLKVYAVTHGLTWVEDESNDDMNFDRNFLRQEIIPTLKQRWPKLVANLARAAKHCADANNFIDNEIKDLFHEIFNTTAKSLYIPKLLAHSGQIQTYILRYWLQHLNLPLLSTKAISILEREILHARCDGAPLLSSKLLQIRRYDNELYAMHPLARHDASLVINWDPTQDLLLPDGRTKLTAADLTALGINPTYLLKPTIRFRQGGERCYLPNRKHSHSLKKLLQTWRVPPWKRDRVPILYEGESIKAIIGYTACG